jgi:hypothetical protein
MRSMLLVACVAAAVAGGCGPKARVTMFDPAEYEPYLKAGTGSIEGQAFIRTQGGGVVTAAGRGVHLNPATEYAREWYESAVINGVPLETDRDQAAGAAIRATRRSTIADASGRFRFDGLPAGEYYITSEISWEVPVGYYGGGVASTRTETYGAHAKVTVQDGQVTRAIVTR